MPTLPLNYDPNPLHAILALFTQALLLGFLAFAIIANARRRHRPKHLLIALAVGTALGTSAGFLLLTWHSLLTAPSFAIAWQQLADWQLIAFFELHWSALFAFFGILASWLSVELLGSTKTTPKKQARR